MGNSASTIASTLVTKQEAQAKYQPKGSYLTTTAAKDTYLTSADAKSTYLASAEAPSKTLWCADGSCKVPNGSNQIVFPNSDTSAMGKPSANGSAGTRVVLWGDGSKFFYGAGVDSNTLWMSTNTPDGAFKFYNQDKEVANISTAGINASTFTASGQMVTPQLSADTVISKGDIVTQGALNAVNVIASGGITTPASVNAKDVIASGFVSAPNLYDRAGVNAEISKATQNLISSGQAANLANMDITPKSIDSQGQVSVPRGSTVRLSGAGDPVHSMGFAEAYGITNVEGPFIAGWQGPHSKPFRGALGTIGNNNGTPATPNVAMFWDAAANTTFPNRLNAREIRIGDWLIRQSNSGNLEFIRVNPDGSLVDGNKSNVGYLAFTGDGNINMRRHAVDGNYDSGWVSDQFIRFNRPFAIQSSRGDYLSNTDLNGAGFRNRPAALTSWETMVARKPFSLDIAPVADDKPHADTKVLFK